MFNDMWAWISANAATLGIVLGAGPTIWAVAQFIVNRRADGKRRQFKNYHSLIKQLVERENADQPMRLDRQIALIFELRRFKDYFPVTLRILNGLTKEWSSYGPHDKRVRLQEELNLTIKYIERLRSDLAVERAPAKALTLNGVQRLWIVGSAVLAILTVLVTLYAWPNDVQLREERAIFAVGLALNAVSFKAERGKDDAYKASARQALQQGARNVRQETYGDLPADDLLIRIRPVLSDTPYAAQLVARESRDTAELWRMRRQYATIAIVGWLSLAFATYAMGWAAAWIRKGFHER